MTDNPFAKPTTPEITGVELVSPKISPEGGMGVIAARGRFS